MKSMMIDLNVLTQVGAPSKKAKKINPTTVEKNAPQPEKPKPASELLANAIPHALWSDRGSNINGL